MTHRGPHGGPHGGSKVSTAQRRDGAQEPFEGRGAAPNEGGGQLRKDSNQKVLQQLGRSHHTLPLTESLPGHQVTVARTLSPRGQ